jgi:hypothetical protein
MDPVDKGIAEGWIDPPRRHGLERVSRHRSIMSVAEAIDEDRG